MPECLTAENVVEILFTLYCIPLDTKDTNGPISYISINTWYQGKESEQENLANS